MAIATSSVQVLRRPVEWKQYVSIRYTERLAEAGIEPSVRSVSDSYYAGSLKGLAHATIDLVSWR